MVPIAIHGKMGGVLCLVLGRHYNWRIETLEGEEKMNKELAEYILNEKGYNYALSDVEEACEFLGHPELTEESHHFHKWASPYERRCFCSAIGYKDGKRYYACHMDDNWINILKNIYPDKEFYDRFGEEYES